MVRQLFLYTFLILASVPLAAQQSSKSKSKDHFREKAQAPADRPGDSRALDATEKLIAKYQLTEEQVQNMHSIQERKLRNLDRIDSLKTSDPTLYYSKLESIQKGTQASIHRMLKTSYQLDLYNQTQIEQRNRRESLRQELAAKGVSKEAREQAVLEVYLE